MMKSFARSRSWILAWLRNDRQRLAIDFPEVWASRRLLWVAAATLPVTAFLILLTWPAALETQKAETDYFGEHPVLAFGLVSGIIVGLFAVYFLFTTPALFQLSKEELKFPRNLCLIITGVIAIQPLCMLVAFSFLRGSAPEGEPLTLLLVFQNAMTSSSFLFGLLPAVLFLGTCVVLQPVKEPLEGSATLGLPPDDGFDGLLPKLLKRLDYRLLLKRPLIRYSQAHLVIPFGIVYLGSIALAAFLIDYLPSEGIPYLIHGAGDEASEFMPILRFYLVVPLLTFAATRILLLNRPFATSTAEDLTLAGFDFTFFATVAAFSLPWGELSAPVDALGFAAAATSLFTGCSFMARYAWVRWNEAPSWRVKWAIAARWLLFENLLLASVAVLYSLVLAAVVLIAFDLLSQRDLFFYFFVPGFLLAIATLSPRVRRLYYQPPNR